MYFKKSIRKFVEIRGVFSVVGIPGGGKANFTRGFLAPTLLILKRTAWLYRIFRGCSP
ncbi:unnamed protein product, partial [Allacma fusca]